jgi:photosystem II stability/assembly factor-like uncharacterized protein
MLAGINGSEFYLTTNSGVTWSSNDTPASFSTFAASADISRLVAVGAGQVYVSTNTGATWVLTSLASQNWTSVASSADGTEFVVLAVENGVPLGFGEGDVGIIYRSTNSGATWSNINDFGDEDFISSIACSGDGATVLMLGWPSYVSNNSGLTWHVLFDGYYSALQAACSADGMTIILLAGGAVFPAAVDVSPDLGVDWYLANEPSSYPETVLISSDGTKFAALNNGNIYISEANPSPTLNVAASASNVLLSWMMPATPFILQQSSDLANWSTVTNAPILNITNLQNQVTLPISQTQSFYRLKTP